jgi:hypothetical protein
MTCGLNCADVEKCSANSITSARGSSSCDVVTITCSPSPSSPMQAQSRASSHSLAPTPVAQKSSIRAAIRSRKNWSSLAQAYSPTLRPKRFSQSRSYLPFSAVRFWPIDRSVYDSSRPTADVRISIDVNVRLRSRHRAVRYKLHRNVPDTSGKT